MSKKGVDRPRVDRRDEQRRTGNPRTAKRERRSKRLNAKNAAASKVPTSRSPTRKAKKVNSATTRRASSDLLINQIAVEQDEHRHRPAARTLGRTRRLRGRPTYAATSSAHRHGPESERRRQAEHRKAKPAPVERDDRRTGHVLHQQRRQPGDLSGRAVQAGSASFRASPPRTLSTPAKSWTSTAWSRRSALFKARSLSARAARRARHTRPSHGTSATATGSHRLRPGSPVCEAPWLSALRRQRLPRLHLRRHLHSRP